MANSANLGILALAESRASCLAANDKKRYCLWIEYNDSKIAISTPDIALTYAQSFYVQYLLNCQFGSLYFPVIAFNT